MAAGSRATMLKESALDKEPFANVHALMRDEKWSAALGILCDAQTGALSEKFLFDRNHAWYCVGDIHFRQEKYELAKQAFKKSVSYRRDDEDALMAIGNCYNALRRSKLAERYFRQALNVPGSTFSAKIRAEMRFNLANSLLDQSRFDEAITLFKRLTRAHVSIRTSARKNLIFAESRGKG